MISADLDRVIQTLRAHAEELRGRGVLHASVFGSVARGDGGPDSDVDILVILDPEKKIDLLEYVGLERHVSELLGRPAELARRDRLKARIRAEALRDEVRAF
jgi:predicted nucleotidyltransferase